MSTPIKWILSFAQILEGNNNVDHQRFNDKYYMAKITITSRGNSSVGTGENVTVLSCKAKGNRISQINL